MKKMAILFVAFLALGYYAKAQETDSLKQYVGKFNFPEGSIVPSVSVVVENGKLSFSSIQGTGSLEKLGVDSFSIPEYQGTCKFVRNGDKQVNGVIIDVMNYHLEGTKEITTTIALLFRQLYLKDERKQIAIR